MFFELSPKKSAVGSDKSKPKLFSDEIMGRQLVDFSDGLDTGPAFEAFVAKRRAAIASRLNDFIGL